MFGFGVLAAIASLSIILVGLPLQIVKNYKRKSTDGISLVTVISILFTYICWSLYAWTKPDWFLVVSQTPGIALSLILLAQALYYRGPRRFRGIELTGEGGNPLFNKRQLLIQGPVNLRMQEQFCREIIRLNAADSETPITVFIDTLGGDTRSSLFMCDAIEYSKAQVHGIVIGKAHSAGFRILQSCRTRTAYKNASLMFHGPAKNTRIDDKNWSFANRESRRLHDEQIKTYQKRSGQDIEKIRAWSQEEKIFTAQEAVKYRFLDKIV